MNTGIIIPDMGASQLGYMALNQANLLAQQNESCFIFFENTKLPCVRPLVSCMNISELHTFNGTLISTSIDTTLYAINSITNTRKIFYVWDLEWLRPNKNNFLYNMQAFRNEQVEIMCRSERHAKLIENYCNRKPSLIFNNLNLLALREHMKDKP